MDLKQKLVIASKILDPVKRKRALDKIKYDEEVAANRRRLERRDSKDRVRG